MEIEAKGLWKHVAAVNEMARRVLPNPSPVRNYDNPQELPLPSTALQQRQLDFKRGFVVGGIFVAFTAAVLLDKREKIMKSFFR